MYEVYYNDVAVYFGGGRIAPLAFHHTLPVCTSEGEGQAFSLKTSATSSEEEGQAILLTVSVSIACP